MVSFQTAEVYNEDEDNIIGVKVKVSADNGQVIDEIQVTNKTELDELKAKLDSLGDDYVKFDDESQLSGMTIEQILQNISETININATELGGIQSDGYAKANHTHDERYYTESEINSRLNEKAAVVHTHDDRYYTETEMNTKLNGKANKEHNHGWTRQDCTKYGSLYINPTLRLCEFSYVRESYNFSQANNWYTLHSHAIPEQYRPKAYKFSGNSNPAVLLLVTDDGDIQATSTLSGSKFIHCSMMWHY